MKQSPSQPYAMIVSTFPDRQSAESMAKRLLDKRLVACVQLSEIESFYHWQGEVANDREIKFTAKTRDEHVAAIHAEIATHHPYDLPQCVTLPISTASEAYLAWIDAETQPLSSKS